MQHFTHADTFRIGDRVCVTGFGSIESADDLGPESDDEEQPPVKHNKRPSAKAKSNSGQEGESKLQKKVVSDPRPATVEARVLHGQFAGRIKVRYDDGTYYHVLSTNILPMGDPSPFLRPALSQRIAFGQPQAAGFGQVGLISTRILSSICIDGCHLSSQCARHE
jgi:hypothetical protein